MSPKSRRVPADTEHPLASIGEADHAPAAPSHGPPVVAPGGALRAPGILSLIAVTLVATAAAIAYNAPIILIAAGGAIAGLWAMERLRPKWTRPKRALVRSRRSGGTIMESELDRSWEAGESSGRIATLFDALGDMFVLCTPTSQIVDANESFRRATGIADPCGMSLAEAGIYPEHIPGGLEIRLGEGDDARVWTWHQTAVRDGASGELQIHAIGREVTAGRKNETALEEARARAEAASTAKTRFLATVSHEIRTPLNGILGMTHLLTQTQVTPEQASYLKTVRESGYSLLALIEDLLDATSIEAGRFHLRQSECDPHDLVQNTCELMAAQAHEKGIEIASYIAPNVPQSVVSDPGRLKQVLFNLIGNAIKFTSEGGILLSVTASDEWLGFQVTDTGPGLKPEDQERVFEEFERADNSSTRRHGGAGLGLSISARIVAALGGMIGVESAIGTGSRFYFSVPLNRSEADGGGLAESSGPDLPLAGKAVLILSPKGPVAESLEATITELGGVAAHAVDRATLPRAVERIARDGGHVTDLLIDRRIAANDSDVAEAAAAMIGNSVDRTLIIAQEDSRDLTISPDLAASKWLVRPVRTRSLVSVLTTRDDRADRDRASGMIAAPALLRPSEAPTFDILLAEDNPVNALVVRTMLARQGHRVTLVENGLRLVDEALDRPDGKCRFDLVITDISMPDLDGISAIRKIRLCEEAESLARLPIVVLSANGQAETRDNILAAGADGHAEKPVDPGWLASLVGMAARPGRAARS